MADLASSFRPDRNWIEIVANSRLQYSSRLVDEEWSQSWSTPAADVFHWQRVQQIGQDCINHKSRSTMTLDRGCKTLMATGRGSPLIPISLSVIMSDPSCTCAAEPHPKIWFLWSICIPCAAYSGPNASMNAACVPVHE
jgi:hypothetical protein